MAKPRPTAWDRDIADEVYRRFEENEVALSQVAYIGMVRQDAKMLIDGLIKMEVKALCGNNTGSTSGRAASEPECK